MNQSTNETWNSAYWRADEEGCICALEAAISGGDPEDIEEKGRALIFLYEKIAFTTFEERTRHFWTNTTWAEKEDAARAQLERYRDPTWAAQVQGEDRAHVIANAEAELAFYQGERQRRFSSLLEGVPL